MAFSIPPTNSDELRELVDFMRTQGIPKLKLAGFELEITANAPEKFKEPEPVAEEVDPNDGLTPSEQKLWFASSS